MHPLYFNPLTPSSLPPLTNPLAGFTIVPHTMQPRFFNPNLYDPFIFSKFPQLAIFGSTLLGSSAISSFSTVGLVGTDIFSTTNGSGTSFTTFIFFSTVTFQSTFSVTSMTETGSYQQLLPVQFSQRFGTELQTLYNFQVAATDTFGTYAELFTGTQAFVQAEVFSYFGTTLLGSTLGTLHSFYGASYLTTLSTIALVNSYPGNQTVVAGSSMFVNMLGSNVYAGLLITTNSIINYENEQVSSYYSQSLSYQINIANLTSALNSVSQTDPTDATGNGDITVTTFSWVWFTTSGGMSGSQVTNFPTYTQVEVVNNYLLANYGVVITNSADAVTQVQSLISVQNNNLENSQTFLNNAVTTLQSQVSLAGQIIASLAAATQAIIANI
ncbi:MAG TPA: hypothetical protein VJK54_08055 [Chthoniobacterales bacterium]|nr:hypothetical protein [Chthoniobacterales bacterium]